MLGARWVRQRCTFGAVGPEKIKSKKANSLSQKRSEFGDPKAQAGPNMWKCTWDEEQHAQDTMPLPGALKINCVKTHVSALAAAK